MDDLSKNKKDQQNFSGKDGVKGQVTVGSKQNPVCVPRTSVITFLGQSYKMP